MPFVKKNTSKGSSPPDGSRKIFVGRANELHFFTEHILKPGDPAYNIISIYGDGGVGKSTLVNRYVEMVNSPTFQEYCLAAIVDERQATPASMMEKFTTQLHMHNEFSRALTQYKEALRKLQDEQETMQDAVLQRAPDFAGAAVEGVPVVGPLLRESLKVTTSQILDRYHTGRTHLASTRLEDPISDLTQAFITEINRLAESLVTADNGEKTKRRRRILLIFDTFEQLAAEAAPWLLDYFLTADISNSIVILTAGRIPIDRSLPEDPKRWLPYRDDNVISSISLTSFSFQETQAYLAQRGITTPERIDSIWQLSRGLPLYLSLLTSDPRSDVDPTTDVVANFLRWIPQSESIKRRLVLDASLFSRPFNQDDLAAFDYIPENQHSYFYHWLIQQPFVHSATPDGRYSYHELAEDLFSRHLYQRSPNACYTARRALAFHYQTELTAFQAQGHLEYYHSEEWLSLTLALSQQLFLLPDGPNHAAAADQLLHAYELTKQDEEITRVLRSIAQIELYNQANTDARQVATLLLNYIEAELESQELATQEFATAATALLQKFTGMHTLSPVQLAHIYGNRGLTYRKLNDYSSAIVDFDRALELDPDYAWAYANRGITHRFNHNYELALQDFNAAIVLDDGPPWVYAARGEVYRHLSNYDLAMQDFNHAIALAPKYASAYGSRGRVYHHLKNFQQSIGDFDRAIALKPEHAWFYAQQGENYRDIGQYSRAIELYNQALALEPNSFFWAYGSRGYTYFRLRDYHRAIEDFSRAIEQTSTYTWGYAQRGRVYRHLDMLDKALADLNRALELDPTDEWAYSHRGLVYSHLHKYQLALADSNRAIGLKPAYANAYGRRGSTYIDLGELDLAAADFARNLELVPDDTLAHWMSIWLVLCRQDPDAQTISHLEEAATTRPQSYFAYLCRGLAFWLCGQNEQARTTLEQAQNTHPKLWDAPFWLTFTWTPENPTQAIHFLEQALTLDISPALLAPLRWLKRDHPAFYAQHVASLLTRYNMF
jgi:tetratricopeptide (TPR) repeat protein